MQKTFKPEHDRKHQYKLTSLEVGDYFEVSALDYDVLRRARTNLGKNPKYSERRWTFKLGKGMLTAKRIEDAKSDN